MCGFAMCISQVSLQLSITHFYLAEKSNGTQITTTVNFFMPNKTQSNSACAVVRYTTYLFCYDYRQSNFQSVCCQVCSAQTLVPGSILHL